MQNTVFTESSFVHNNKKQGKCKTAVQKELCDERNERNSANNIDLVCWEQWLQILAAAGRNDLLHRRFVHLYATGLFCVNSTLQC